jgi:hypothetical protein
MQAPLYVFRRARKIEDSAFPQKALMPGYNEQDTFEYLTPMIRFIHKFISIRTFPSI